ncbi:MAG: hypothetical protein PHP29_06375 [Tissierellia bacterium]|nr:hypothetical protein [Tissierellia bacterium]
MVIIISIKYYIWNFMEKAIVKKIAKVSSDKSDIKHDNIKKLAMEMNN